MTKVRELFWRENWNVGVVRAPVHSLLESATLPPVEWLPARRDSFAADPFGVEVDGRIHLFFEQFDYRARKGVIAHVELADGAEPAAEVVLDLPVHVSYPFPVRHDGEIYLVPETVEAREVALYGADSFPRGWRRVATLLEGVEAVDPTLFRHDGRWWLFATLRDRGEDSDLFAWHADDLLGPWRPHAESPLKSDAGSARPAGPPFLHAGELYRPAQDCSASYGGRVVLNRVESLSPTVFREHAVGSLSPDRSGDFPAGLHTLCAVGDITVVDGKRLVARPPGAYARAFARRLGRR